MTIIYETKESFEKVKKFLTRNQYMFKCIEKESLWEIIITEWD